MSDQLNGRTAASTVQERIPGNYVNHPGRRPALTSDRANIAANDDVGLLNHLDPRSVSFYSDAAAAAAYLVNDSKGRWLTSCQCMVTALLMHLTVLAARENRVCSLSDVQSALAEANRRLQSRNHHRRDTKT